MGPAIERQSPEARGLAIWASVGRKAAVRAESGMGVLGKWAQSSNCVERHRSPWAWTQDHHHLFGPTFSLAVAQLLLSTEQWKEAFGKDLGIAVGSTSVMDPTGLLGLLGGDLSRLPPRGPSLCAHSYLSWPGWAAA